MGGSAIKHIIISVSRQFGSGGAKVARSLGLELGIPVYERQLIEMAAAKTGLSPKYIDSLEEAASRSFLFNLVSAPAEGGVVAQYDVPLSFSAYAAQSTVIKELAGKGSAVIVGRCSDYILRGDPDCVRLFLHADFKDRVAAIMERESLSEKDAEKRVRKMDKGRSNYYRSFTGEEWGAVGSYDLCLNTSSIGADAAVEVILTYLRASHRL